MIKRWLRKWLGIEAMQLHLDLLTPKDFGAAGFKKVLYKGKELNPTSSALKSMTPLERSREDNQEMLKRIDHLLS